MRIAVRVFGCAVLEVELERRQDVVTQRLRDACGELAARAVAADTASVEVSSVWQRADALYRLALVQLLAAPSGAPAGGAMKK